MIDQHHRLVALTGASGFIGKILLSRFLSEGWKVRVLTRHPEKWSKEGLVDVFVGDLVETKDWSAFVSGVDLLVHAAAEIRRHDLMMAVNFQGPERLLHAAVAAGVSRWIQLSSVGAYGPFVSGLVDEKTLENPVGPYEKTKTLFDRLLINSDYKNNMRVCIVRPSNVYGPGMSNQSLFQMMKMIRQGLFSYIGPVGASANYVHVNDVVNAVVLCAKLPKAAGKIYIVSDWTTLENMVQAMAKGLKVMPPKRRLKIGPMLWFAKFLQWIPRFPLTVGRVKALCSTARYSTNLIEDELGWYSSVPVTQGMFELTSKLKFK